MNHSSASYHVADVRTIGAEEQDDVVALRRSVMREAELSIEFSSSRPSAMARSKVTRSDDDECSWYSMWLRFVDDGGEERYCVEAVVRVDVAGEVSARWNPTIAPANTCSRSDGGVDEDRVSSSASRCC